MSKPNNEDQAHLLRPFILLLVFTSAFSPILAAADSPATDRIPERSDPLSHFKYYNEGYNVRDKHYWASAAFTGVHGYAIAGGWLLCGLGLGIYLVLKPHYCNSSSIPITDHPENHHRYHLFTFVLVLLFTFLAIVATGFVLATNQNSFRRTKRLLGAIYRIAEDANGRIRHVIRNMRTMQELLLPYEPNISQALNTTTHQLRKTSQGIQDFIHHDMNSINMAMKSSHVVHIVVVSINSVSLVAALVMLLLHWYRGLIVVIIFCWILTTLFWVLTGVDFFLHTFAEDTCSAFKSFHENPQNSTLRSILPCTSPSEANEFLEEISYNVHNFVTEVNSKITMISKLWKICDPFPKAPNYNYEPEKCPGNAISVAKLPYVLSQFTCDKGERNGACMKEGKFLPKEAYDMAHAYSRSISNLVEIYPDLRYLLECSFAKKAICDMVSHQCRPFRVSLRLLWYSILSLSIFMVVLVLTWVAKAYQDKGKCPKFSVLHATR